MYIPHTKLHVLKISVWSIYSWKCRNIDHMHCQKWILSDLIDSKHATFDYVKIARRPEPIISHRLSGSCWCCCMYCFFGQVNVKCVNWLPSIVCIGLSAQTFMKPHRLYVFYASPSMCDIFLRQCLPKVPTICYIPRYLQLLLSMEGYTCLCCLVKKCFNVRKLLQND